MWCFRYPVQWFGLAFVLLLAVSLCLGAAQKDKPALEDQTSMPVKVDESFSAIMARGQAAKPKLMERQQQLPEARYDLRNDPSDVMMSGGRKAVQQGVRVKLPQGLTWEELAAMSPQEIKRRNLFPMGSRPLPHAHHTTGGQVFPQNQIEAMQRLEQRDLSRFDVEFDLPDRASQVAMTAQV